MVKYTKEQMLDAMEKAGFVILDCFKELNAEMLWYGIQDEKSTDPEIYNKIIKILEGKK